MSLSSTRSVSASICSSLNLFCLVYSLFYPCLSWFFRISRQMSMSICFYLPVLILSVDSDWLISIKAGQSLTWNRNYFYLRQSWSNFDRVRQSGVYTIKVSNQSPPKWNWSNFDKVNFDSVNRLLSKQDRISDSLLYCKSVQRHILFSICQVSMYMFEICCCRSALQFNSTSNSGYIGNIWAKTKYAYKWHCDK